MSALQLLLLSVGFVLLSFFCQSGSAISCYECNSHNDSRCAEEKLSQELVKDCSLMKAPDNSEYTMCRKITQSIEFEVNGLQPDSRVIRSCGWDVSNYKGRCYQRSGFGGRQEVCSCTTDLCNSSSTVKALSVIFLVVQIAVFSKIFL